MPYFLLYNANTRELDLHDGVMDPVTLIYFFMYEFQNDSNLVFLIFQNLDAKSLLRCSEVCRLWNSIVKSFPTVLWKALSKKDFNVSELHEHDNYLQLYQTHYNFHAGRYKFVSADQNFRYQHKVDFWTYPIDANNLYCVWPSLKMNSYLVAHVKEYVCWIDNSSYFTRPHLYVTSLKDKDLSIDRVVSPDRRLDVGADMGPLGLLLTNHESLLLVFNDRSQVFVWNMDTFEMEGIINTRTFVPNHVAMNTNRNYLIVGETNVRVGIWNIHTKMFEKGLTETDVVGVPKNVGISDDVVVYALNDGTYHIHDFRTLEKRFVVSVGQETFFRKPNFRPVSMGDIHADESEEEIEREIRAISNSQSTPSAQYLSTIADFPAAAVFMDDFMNLPTTLSVNNHVLITNGYGDGNMSRANNVLVWDLKTGQLINSLSESTAMDRYSLSPAQQDTIRVAEVTTDGTIVFCSVDDMSDSGRLFVWDFCSKERAISGVKLSLLPGEGSFPTNVWVLSRCESQ
jgi:hypothetical protein